MHSQSFYDAAGTGWPGRSWPCPPAHSPPPCPPLAPHSQLRPSPEKLTGTCACPNRLAVHPPPSQTSTPLPTMDLRLEPTRGSSDEGQTLGRTNLGITGVGTSESPYLQRGLGERSQVQPCKLQAPCGSHGEALLGRASGPADSDVELSHAPLDHNDAAAPGRGLPPRQALRVPYTLFHWMAKPFLNAECQVAFLLASEEPTHLACAQHEGTESPCECTWAGRNLGGSRSTWKTLPS